MDFVFLDGSSLKLSMQGCVFPWILQSWILNPNSNGQIIPIFQGQPDHPKNFHSGIFPDNTSPVAEVDIANFFLESANRYSAIFFVSAKR